jgi:hypothetical protein
MFEPNSVLKGVDEVKGFNTVGMCGNGEITVVVGKDEPIEALFSKDKLQVGGMWFKPKKNVEIVIRLTIESEE